MTRYMLDTCICIAVIRNRNLKIFTRMAKCGKGEIGISVITLAELSYGVEKSAKPGQNAIALNEFCAPLEIWPFDMDATAHYGRIRAALEKKGETIGPLDMLIAAHALSAGCVLVSDNEREFRRVKGLKVENWI